jgi:hypothetical protein
MVSNQDFIYSNNGTSASFNSVAQGIPIFLMIADGFAPSLGRVQAAHFFLTSTTTDATIPPVSPDDFTRQHLTNPANSIHVVLDTPFAGQTNFLTVMFSNGLLSGRLNATEASLKTSDADSGNRSRVDFTSDFIDFSNAIEHGFSLSFSSVNSADGSGNLQMEDSFFKSFLASGTGTFDTSFASPVAEPCSLILAAFGLLGVLGLAYKSGQGK